MPLKDRQKIMKQIEKCRDGRALVCFFNFDRLSDPSMNGLGTHLSPEARNFEPDPARLVRRARTVVRRDPCELTIRSFGVPGGHSSGCDLVTPKLGRFSQEGDAVTQFAVISTVGQ